MLPWAAAALLAWALFGAYAPFSVSRSIAISSRLASLDLEEKAAQVLLVGVEGAEVPSADTQSLLERMPVGGVVLLGYNLTANPVDAGHYIAALQSAAARNFESRSKSQSKSRSDSLPLIVAIDHEGGVVFRFKGEGITRVPPPSEVGKKGGKYAYALGRAAGSELRALGITMALAPVVELLTDDNKAFLGTRSYGSSGKIADAAAGSYIEGLQTELVAAVAKHFPGNAGEDPHRVLPELGLSEAAYRRDYSPRFASAIRRGVSSIMLSHVVFRALDPERPASLSPLVVKGELRGRLGFRGLVLTDDVGMRALAATRDPGTSAVEALVAGADLVMLVDSGEAPRVRDAIVRAVREGKLPAARLEEAVRRVLELKSRFRMEAASDLPARERALAGFPALVEKNALRLKDFRQTDPR
jgi:beta-N-acetylhexosaminidase